MNEHELTKLWEKYFPRVYGYFFRRVTSRPDVEDLTSVTMTALLQRLQNNAPDNLEAYLWRTAKNQLTLYIRTKSRRPATVELTPELDPVAATNHERDTRIDAQDRLAKFYRLSQEHLSLEEYKLLQMTYKRELNATEIAKLLDLRPATVRKRVSRALKKLKPHLKNF